MIKTLRDAVERQNNHELIGQIDLDGSFTALLRRELIDVETITIKGKKERSWYVTSAGIKSLNKLDIKSCERAT
ncbi:MAG: hypothetical protein ABIO81_02245 [Ginsengibacter sp.]